MAPKRGMKQAKVVNNEDLYKNLALSDALCPICRYILVLPITLPCNHNFCSSCFDGTVANANLTCPLCRVRFASWLRIARKEGRLVNVKLWLQVQTKFADKVRNRQDGIDEDLEEVGVRSVRLASSGEIRREYEEQLKRDTEDLKRKQQEEEIASAQLIKKLKEQDRIEEAQYEEKLRLDMKVARELDVGLKSTVHNTPKKRPLDKFIQNMKLNAVPNLKHVKHEDVDFDVQCKTELPHSDINLGASTSKENKCDEKERSAKQKNLMNFAEVIEISDSNDSIENECRYFKPIDYRNIPPSTAGSPPLKVPAVFTKNISFKFEPLNKMSQLNLGTTSAFVKFVTQSRKRKLSENSRQKIIKKFNLLDSEQLYSSIKPRKELGGPSTEKKLPHMMTLRDRKSSTTSPTTLLTPAALLNGITPSHENLDRLEQERSDLELAKKLQEEFNRERYTTRSSISCRNNIKKTRQLTLTEIMSTSKCK